MRALAFLTGHMTYKLAYTSILETKITLAEDDQPTIMVGGGFNRFKLQETTEFLSSGASQWTVGPNLPRRSKDTTLVRLPHKQGVAMIGGMGSAAGENYTANFYPMKATSTVFG